MATTKKRSFYETVTAAVLDISEHGFDTAGRIEFWSEQIRLAAVATMLPSYRMEAMLKDAYSAIYLKLIERGGIARYHPGVERFTIQRLKPKLRGELDRRILASANLIRLNRAQAIDKTLQRFAGWSTSIPAGGSAAVSKAETKDDIRKALAQLPFEDRRVLIDQGHKLTASLSEIIANDGGAIAGKWHSNWRQSGYDYREDHKDRDEQVYAVRGNWAIQRGLMKAGPNGFYDRITRAGEEPFCRCHIQWVYSLGELPSDMLTDKGRKALRGVRADSDGFARADAEESDVIIDYDYDVKWMSVMSRDRRRMYVDRTLPREIMNNGRPLVVARPLLEHETDEYDGMAEEGMPYLEAHLKRGIPGERRWIEENDYDWASWEAWCRGELARLEHRPIINPPPDPHVREDHDRRKLVSNI